MFKINFISDDVLKTQSSANESNRFAEIAIGDFSEQFLIPTEYWSEQDYISQWKEAINRLTNEDKNSKSALIVAMHDPQTVNFINWWVMYKDIKQKIVYIQNNLLFTDALAEDFNISNIYRYISDRKTRTEEGDRISEWQATIKDLVDFARILKT